MMGFLLGKKDVRGDGRRWWKTTEEKRGMGEGHINKQIRQQISDWRTVLSPQGIREKGGERGESHSLVHSFLTHTFLDKAPDYLGANYQMHVKMPAGSWDNMVFLIRAHTPSCFTAPCLHPPGPFIMLKLTHFDSTWLWPQPVPPAETAGGCHRLGTSIFQALSALSLTRATRSPRGGVDGETEAGRRLELETHKEK